MKITPIESTSNPLLKSIRALQLRKEREKTGLFLIEGRKGLAEALQKDVVVDNIVVSRSYLEAQPDVVANHDIQAVCVVDDRLFQDLTTTVTPEGIIAVAKIPQYKFENLFPANSDPLIVVVHSIQDPGNLGTIIRTSLAASASGIVLTRGTVDPYNPKVVRAAMGALFGLPILFDIEYTEAVEELKKRRVKVVACQANVSKNYYDCDFTGALAFVLGNEGQGLNDSDLALADEMVAIPMNPKSESLNVAIAGAVILFSAVEQRQAKLRSKR